MSAPLEISTAATFRMLVDRAGEFSDRDYWRLVRMTWLHGAGRHDTGAVGGRAWANLFSADRPGRHELMTPAERDRLGALPDVVSIYRGVNPESDPRGLSWTLRRDIGAAFAYHRSTAGGPMHLLSGRVERAAIVALFDARDEHEVIVWPQDVREPRSEGLAPTGRRAYGRPRSGARVSAN